jgi:hypothetical protein
VFLEQYCVVHEVRGVRRKKKKTFKIANSSRLVELSYSEATMVSVEAPNTHSAIPLTVQACTHPNRYTIITVGR